MKQSMSPGQNPTETSIYLKEACRAGQTFGTCRNAKPKQKGLANVVRTLPSRENVFAISTAVKAPGQKQRKGKCGQNMLAFSMAIILHK